MNLTASSEFEPKKPSASTLKQREKLIASRLEENLRGTSSRAISRATGYNSETIRRYLNGDSKIPADFVAQVARHYQKDGYYLLDISRSFNEHDLQSIPLSQLLDELSRRICRIEDYSVGSSLVGQLSTVNILSPQPDQ